MQTGKNDTNDMKVAKLARKNYGRNIIIHALTNLVSGSSGRPESSSGQPLDNQGFSQFFY